MAPKMDRARILQATDKRGDDRAIDGSPLPLQAAALEAGTADGMESNVHPVPVQTGSGVRVRVSTLPHG